MRPELLFIEKSGLNSLPEHLLFPGMQLFAECILFGAK
jgi:hypothetical protein